MDSLLNFSLMFTCSLWSQQITGLNGGFIHLLHCWMLACSSRVTPGVKAKNQMSFRPWANNNNHSLGIRFFIVYKSQHEDHPLQNRQLRINIMRWILFPGTALVLSLPSTPTAPFLCIYFMQGIVTLPPGGLTALDVPTDSESGLQAVLHPFPSEWERSEQEWRKK